jgi:hypothetical protein
MTIFLIKTKIDYNIYNNNDNNNNNNNNINNDNNNIYNDNNNNNLFHSIDQSNINNGTNINANLLIIDFDIKKKFKKINNEDINKNKYLRNNISSLSHLEVSEILIILNIEHDNEIFVNNFHYSVDIFITTENIEKFYEKNNDFRKNNYCDFLNDQNNSNRNKLNFDNNNNNNNDKIPFKGVVLEFDGPFHYESYLQVFLNFYILFIYIYCTIF